MSGSGRKRNASGSSNSRHPQKRTDTDENVEVVCRLTPYRGSDPCLIPIDETTIKCVTPNGGRRRDEASSSERLYNFGAVFDDYNSQEDIFKHCGLDLITSFVSGGNALLFSYGVTGSGKTYTMTGRPPSEAGVLPRSLDVIFNSIENRVSKGVFYSNGRNGYGIRTREEAIAERERMANEILQLSTEVESRIMDEHKVDGYCDDYVCAIFVSYFEIYNNNFYDLLAKDDSQIKKDRRDGNDQVYIEGITEIEVENSDDALEVFCRGEQKRKTSNTLLNKDSSRSHAIFNIRLVMAPMDIQAVGIYPVQDPAKIVVSQLSLVDLAGSERAKRTKNTGDRLAEAANINKSLMVLRQCIEKLRKNQRSRRGNIEQIPYRDSKLTHLFKNYFEGGGKIRMIICANPKPDDYDENLNVFAFAEESQALKVKGSEKPDFECYDENGPPVSRRFYANWMRSADELMTFSDFVPESINVQPGLLSIKDPFDDGPISYAKECLEMFANQNDTMSKTFTEIVRSVRYTHCHYDSLAMELRTLAEEKERSDKKLSEITAKYKQSQREMRSVNDRIRQYEAESHEMVGREENLRADVLEQKKKQRQTEQCLKQIGNVLESVSPTVAQLRGRFDKVDKDNSSRETRRVAKRPPLPEGASARSGAATGSVPNVREPSVHRLREQFNQGGRGYINPKNRQRRSKSAPRILDHISPNPVPTGTIMVPKVPNGKKVTQPEVHQLQKASDYVLTHQEVDEEGNISTSMYKENEFECTTYLRHDCTSLVRSTSTLSLTELEH